MSRSLGNVIADSLQLSLGYAERLLKNVPADRAGRFAVPGGVIVESNHPAFIYGHLSLYAPKILRLIGHPAPPIPDGFELVFSKDAKCVDDADGDLPAIGDQEFLEGHADHPMRRMIRPASPWR